VSGSVGTGKLRLIQFATSVIKNEIGEALVAIVTDTEQVANTFQIYHTSNRSSRSLFRVLKNIIRVTSTSYIHIWTPHN
jgi:hypothetical protein